MPKIHYGTQIHPATKSIARAFGSQVKPALLQTGQKTTYHSGKIILKPADDTQSTTWSAKIFNKLPNNKHVRFPRPIKSTDGKWIHDGYIACTFLEGKHVKGKYHEKLDASIAFHQLLKNIKKPSFLGTPKSSWSTADLVAWDKIKFKYDTEFMELYKQIKPHLKSLNLPSQLIHGDLSGNFLVHPKLPPAIIDFSPAWAPNGFAEGIMLADAITWEHARPKDLEPFRKINHMEQFAWRGILRRITEQAEHIKWFGKDKKEAITEARVFQKAIDYMESKPI